jgi:hypothetical protein
MLTARVAAFLRDADELADVHEDMPDAGHVAVDDVEHLDQVCPSPG